MSAIAWVRNALIFGGIAVGGAFAIRAATAPAEVADDDISKLAPPVVLNTARPPASTMSQLGKPVSLESPFGRTEITGIATFRVSPDPLSDIGINRDFDGAIDLKPAQMVSDLPAKKAAEEVAPREDAEPAPAKAVSGINLDDLPKDAREHADNGKSALDSGNALLIDGLEIVRSVATTAKRAEGNQMLADAARFFEQARDHFREALLRAPNHPGVLELIQEAKANLFTARKHGTTR